MKNIRTLSLAGVLALASIAQSGDFDPARANLHPKSKPLLTRPDRIAHEWGTFTQVIGSDGVTLPWWTPTLEGPAALPEFVKPVFSITGGKTAAHPWTVRMETPVIYFYANQPAKLTVNVDESRIPFTEVFPNVANPFLLGSGIMPNAEGGGTSPPPVPTSHRQWKVEIRPPDDSIGTKMPQVGERGQHYQYARAVADAWWVVGPKPEKAEREVEKFIFYRGAGDTTMPPRVARIDGDQIHFFPTERPQFIVETSPSGLRWKRVVPTLADEEHQTIAHRLPSADTHAKTDEAALSEALEDELVNDGLTPEEAAAMVATWRESWLGESGLRVLELLPRDWIDQTLPLSISPAPAEIERVFVARWELITPTLEKQVLDILEGDGSAEAKMKILKKLDLGRFGTAIFDRVANLRDQHFRGIYRSLVAELEHLDFAPENPDSQS